MVVGGLSDSAASEEEEKEEEGGNDEDEGDSEDSEQDEESTQVRKTGYAHPSIASGVIASLFETVDSSASAEGQYSLRSFTFFLSSSQQRCLALDDESDLLEADKDGGGLETLDGIDVGDLAAGLAAVSASSSSDSLSVCFVLVRVGGVGVERPAVAFAFTFAAVEKENVVAVVAEGGALLLLLLLFAQRILLLRSTKKTLSVIDLTVGELLSNSDTLSGTTRGIVVCGEKDDDDEEDEPPDAVALLLLLALRRRTTNWLAKCESVPPETEVE